MRDPRLGLWFMGVTLLLCSSCGSTEDKIVLIMEHHESEWKRCSLIQSKIDEHAAEATRWMAESPLRASQETEIAAQHAERFDRCWSGWKKAVRLHFKEAGLSESDFIRAVEQKRGHGETGQTVESPSPPVPPAPPSPTPALVAPGVPALQPVPETPVSDPDG